MESRRHQIKQHQNLDNESSPRFQSRTFRGGSFNPFSSPSPEEGFDNRTPESPRSNWSVENERTYGKGKAWRSPEERRAMTEDQGQLNEERHRSSYSALERNPSYSASNPNYEGFRDEDRYRTRDFSGQRDYGNDMNRASERSHIGKGPKGYRRSENLIKEEVSEALYRHRDVDASDIEVLVSAGTVTLNGTVEDRQQKRLAENIVENVMGVENVINMLMVQPKGIASENPADAEPTAKSARTRSIR